MMLKITIEPYQSEFKTISDSSYRSKVLNRKINQMTKVVMTLQKIRLLFILCFEFPVYLSLQRNIFIFKHI